jgi:hypothetical protein
MEEITFAASGDGLREQGARLPDGGVVEWDEDGFNVRPGPNASKYESVRKQCGAHLTFNAFWKVKHFCVQQMLPRDGMHAIDLGALIRLICAILWKYYYCAEQQMDMEGLAAARLEERLRMYLARRDGPDGQMYVSICKICIICNILHSLQNFHIVHILHIKHIFLDGGGSTTSWCL